jgi:hypothetical protein
MAEGPKHYVLFRTVKPFPYPIHVPGDKPSDNLAAYFRRFGGRDSITVRNSNCDSGESIRPSLSLATSFPDREWAYFCEDDYQLIRSGEKVLRFEPLTRQEAVLPCLSKVEKLERS